MQKVRNGLRALSILRRGYVMESIILGTITVLIMWKVAVELSKLSLDDIAKILKRIMKS